MRKSEFDYLFKAFESIIASGEDFIENDTLCFRENRMLKEENEELRDDIDAIIGELVNTQKRCEKLESELESYKRAAERDAEVIESLSIQLEEAKEGRHCCGKCKEEPDSIVKVLADVVKKTIENERNGEDGVDIAEFIERLEELGNE